jgi:hypothetical protein
MDKVDIQNICNTKKKNNTITFEDGKNDYSFSLSKSTLSKRFTSKTIVHEFDVEILKNPLSELEKIITQKGLLWGAHQNIKNTIYLPLYSLRDGKVPQKSGLNLWNSGGRTRNANEVEIRIPVEVKNYFPQFFPNRDTPFNLKLPNGEKLSSKVCQQEGKGLMSNPNKLLGKWILRDVLKLQEGELFTDEKLKILGIDSVRIDKINNSEFEINFAKIGSYEQFITANQ